MTTARPAPLVQRGTRDEAGDRTRLEAIEVGADLGSMAWAFCGATRRVLAP